MKITQRMAASVALVAAGALVLAGCSGGTQTGSDSGPIDTSGELSGTIQFQTWSLKNEKFTPYFEKLIADFTAEHPQVKVEWLDQPGDGYQDKILSQANSGTLPDVLNLPPDIAYPLVAAGKLVDLDTADTSLQAKYNEGAWQAYSEYSGITGTFGLPWYLSSDAAWWNLAQLAPFGVTADNLPKDNDSFLALAEKVAQESSGKVQLVSSMPTLDTFVSDGIEIIDSSGEFVFNTDKAVALVEKYADAYKAGAMPAETLTGDYAGNATMFKQEKVAYTSGGTGFTTDLQKDAPSLLANVAVTPRLGIPPLFVQGVNVSADSKNKPAALAFAEFVTNEDNQIAFSTLAVGTAPGTSAGGDAVADAVAKNITNPHQVEAIKTVFDAISGAKATPYQWTGAMTTYMNQQLALAIKGDADAKETLDKVVSYANDNRVEP